MGGCLHWFTEGFVRRSERGKGAPQDAVITRLLSLRAQRSDLVPQPDRFVAALLAMTAQEAAWISYTASTS